MQAVDVLDVERQPHPWGQQVKITPARRAILHPFQQRSEVGNSSSPYPRVFVDVPGTALGAIYGASARAAVRKTRLGGWRANISYVSTAAIGNKTFRAVVWHASALRRMRHMRSNGAWANLPTDHVSQWMSHEATHGSRHRRGNT